MEILLETQHLRQLKIIRLFLDNHNELTALEISSAINTSVPTVKKDLMSIQEAFQAKVEFRDKIAIVQEKSLYILKIYNGFDFRSLKTLFLRDSISYHFLKEIVLDNVKTPLDFSYQENLSYSSLYSRFNKINDILFGFDLKLNSYPANSILGSEQQIRVFAIHFFRYTGQIEEWPFPEISREVLNQRANIFLATLKEKYAVDLNLVEDHLFRIILFVTYARVRNKNFITEEDISIYSHYVYNSQLYRKTSADFDLFLSYFCPDPKQRKLEMIALYGFIFTRSSAQAFEQEDTYEHLHKQITQSFLQSLNTKLGCEQESPFPVNEDTLDQLNALHYQTLHFKISLEYFRKININNKKDQKIFDFFSNQIKYIVDESFPLLPKNMSDIFLDSTDMLLRQYYNIFSIHFTTKMFLPPIFVKIVSHNGVRFSNTIAKQISHNLFHYNIVFVENDSYDLLVTDLDNISAGDARLFTYVDPFQSTYLKSLDTILSHIEAQKKESSPLF